MVLHRAEIENREKRRNYYRIILLCQVKVKVKWALPPPSASPAGNAVQGQENGIFS